MSNKALKSGRKNQMQYSYSLLQARAFCFYLHLLILSNQLIVQFGIYS